MSSKPVRIGVTGGICTGKSTVARRLAGLLGFELLDLDQVARGLMQKGAKGWRKVLEAFGTSILGPDGEIQRRKLGELVFCDSEKRRLLEEILHPLVERRMQEAFSEAKKGIVVDAPLLIEKGTFQEMDIVVLVYADQEVQIKRLMERDGLSREEALQRIRSQLPLLEKVAYAHYLVNNSYDLQYTEEQVLKVYKAIRQTLGGVHGGPAPV